jgi:hypothetical protein
VNVVGGANLYSEWNEVVEDETEAEGS